MDIFVKRNHDKIEYTKVDFLKKSMKKKLPGPPGMLRERNRGIPMSKKEDIIIKLTPLMPQNRRHFWETIHIADVEEEGDCFDD